MDDKLLEEARKPHGDAKVILSLEQKGFCVSRLRRGTSTKEKEAKDVAEFEDLIKSAAVSWVDYVVEDLKRDAPEVAKSIGFSEQLVNSLLSRLSESGYEDLDSEMGLLVPVISAQGFDVKIEYMLVLLRNNLVVTLHTTQMTRFFRLRRYAKIFMKKIKPKLSKEDRITILLTRILDESNSRNFDALRNIEKSADNVSEMLSRTDTDRELIGRQIHAMKHGLMIYMNGLWETIDVLNTLRYGDPELLSDNRRLLERIGALTIETNYQIELAEHMSQVLASGLEVMQSIYNNQLQILNNNLALVVAYLTVIGTAVLVPNTLATIFGVSFFDDFGTGFLSDYLILILLSTVISVLLAYLWVRKSGLLPKGIKNQ
ncbi:magnesium transporter CorA [Candidatus Micrarchaeota archaeon]|nr:magnesium transporter CorA [Candidatus Micrarchaeota archaeon]